MKEKVNFDLLHDTSVTPLHIYQLNRAITVSTTDYDIRSLKCHVHLLLQATVNRGVARNLLRGQQKESGGRKSPSGVQGQSPGGGLGQSPQKPETNANFQLRQGTCTHVPTSLTVSNICDSVVNDNSPLLGYNSPSASDVSRLIYVDRMITGVNQHYIANLLHHLVHGDKVM